MILTEGVPRNRLEMKCPAAIWYQCQYPDVPMSCITENIRMPADQSFSLPEVLPGGSGSSYTTKSRGLTNPFIFVHLLGFSHVYRQLDISVLIPAHSFPQMRGCLPFCQLCNHEVLLLTRFPWKLRQHFYHMFQNVRFSFKWQILFVTP